MTGPPPARPADVIARRRRERAVRIGEARAFAGRLDPDLDVCAVVVVGSVARGDFHEHSDVDVLVVARRLPSHYPDRLAALGWPVAGRVEPIAWTPAEYARQTQRRNPVALEATFAGVWLVGTPASCVEGGKR